MILSTKEKIKIELSEDIGAVFISVNSYDYAYIDYADISDINLKKLRVWIEETYYTNDYLSSAYIPAKLNISEFTK